MRAKKSLGQHFLTNPAIASKIVESLAPINATSTIVEIGPGKGILTEQLIRRPEQLVLIEKDHELIASLKEHYESTKCTVVEIDFLRADLQKLVGDMPFHLIGNFPYNISSQIVFKMLDNRDHIPQMVGMFQKEVALRLASKHGSRQYGILSVLLQLFYSVEVLFQLQPGAFTPPPKVKSAVIRCLRKPEFIMPLEEEKFLRKVVKLAFGQRRKMMRNSLQVVLRSCTDTTPVQKYLTMRPEQLSPTEFLEISRSLFAK